MAFFPNPGLRGGSAEGDAQLRRVEDQLSLDEILALLARGPPRAPEEVDHGQPWNQLPLAEEFQPQRALTLDEIKEMQRLRLAEELMRR
jgi:hypothetical protein